MNVAYQWFLGYNLLEDIPHFATVSFAFYNRFLAELSEEIFVHMWCTHILAPANKKKFQKEQVARTATVYEQQLREEVAQEREDDDDPPEDGGGTVNKTVSTPDPDCGMFVKGSHERQFAYEAHTACDRHDWILGVEVTPGNVSESIECGAVFDQVTGRFPEAKIYCDGLWL